MRSLPGAMPVPAGMVWAHAATNVGRADVGTPTPVQRHWAIFEEAFERVGEEEGAGDVDATESAQGSPSSSSSSNSSASPAEE